MTPQQAVDNLVRTGVTRNDRARLRLLFESVASTAHDNETRRCADLVRFRYGTEIAKDILTTGRLKVEDGNPQTGNHG